MKCVTNKVGHETGFFLLGKSFFSLFHLCLTVTFFSSVVNAAHTFYNGTTTLPISEEDRTPRKRISKTLNMTTNPEEKRKIIGDTFVKVSVEAAVSFFFFLPGSESVLYLCYSAVHCHHLAQVQLHSCVYFNVCCYLLFSSSQLYLTVYVVVSQVANEVIGEMNLKPEEVFLAQGTLRPDLIESASHIASGKAEVIKTHHNDTELIRKLRDEVLHTHAHIPASLFNAINFINRFRSSMVFFFFT